MEERERQPWRTLQGGVATDISPRHLTARRRQMTNEIEDEVSRPVCPLKVADSVHVCAGSGVECWEASAVGYTDSVRMISSFIFSSLTSGDIFSIKCDVQNEMF